MKLSSFLAAIDFVHHYNEPESPHAKRMLTGHVFGVDLPAWVIFHAMLGYVLLGVGLVTMLLRLPLKPARRQRWLHPYLGYTWVFGTVWMPITAIWCVQAKLGWDVVAFFIYSMYATIQLAWLFIKAQKSGEEKASLSTSNDTQQRRRWKVRPWVALHGAFMFYSFVMLLGAGISFPFRSENRRYAESG